MALDPEHKLVLEVVPGRRTFESCLELVEAVHERTEGRPDLLLTSDEHQPYPPAIQAVYEDAQTGELPKELVYSTVHKEREKGRVKEVRTRLLFGTLPLLLAYLDRSVASEVVNTSFVERQNGTDRHRCSRKVRKTYQFSKQVEVHDAATYFTLYSYNFCWPVRTLATKQGARTPAMAAKLADHVWSLAEWLLFPARPATS